MHFQICSLFGFRLSILRSGCDPRPSPAGDQVVEGDVGPSRAPVVIGGRVEAAAFYKFGDSGSETERKRSWFLKKTYKQNKWFFRCVR